MENNELWEEIQVKHKVGGPNMTVHVGNLTKENVNFLIGEIGNKYSDDPYEDRQNDAPSIREMLELTDKLRDKVRYHGYVVLPPRSDYRLSLEGFQLTGLTNEELADVIDMAKVADEFEQNLTGDGWYIHTWWD